MAWDLRSALLKKEEIESARLQDFDFRQRVRAIRLLARRQGWDENQVVAASVDHNEEALLDWISVDRQIARAHLAQEYGRCLAEARRQLIGERGDPAPHRLA